MRSIRRRPLRQSTILVQRTSQRQRRCRRGYAQRPHKIVWRAAVADIPTANRSIAFPRRHLKLHVSRRRLGRRRRENRREWWLFVRLDWGHHRRAGTRRRTAPSRTLAFVGAWFASSGCSTVRRQLRCLKSSYFASWQAVTQVGGVCYCQGRVRFPATWV
jgi:hypothetical protein